LSYFTYSDTNINASVKGGLEPSTNNHSF
jgi:hypothetical protein